MLADSKPIIDQGSSPAGETDRPTAADVLRTALELIPDEGYWCKGAYAEADGEPITDRISLYAAYNAGRVDRCCAEGALLLAYRRLHVSVDYLWLGPKDGAYRLVCEQIGVGFVDLAGFNDSPHTTYAEIANAFRRAIAVAEGREP